MRTGQRRPLRRQQCRQHQHHADTQRAEQQAAAGDGGEEERQQVHHQSWGHLAHQVQCGCKYRHRNREHQGGMIAQQRQPASRLLQAGDATVTSM